MQHESDISLRHLKALNLLLEVRSLTKAAEILGTNQPTVSKMLARLRAHFGDPLFVRVGLMMQPTPRALEIAEPLRGLLAVSDNLRAAAADFDPATSQREFKLLVSEVGMFHLIPQMIQALERMGPGLRLKAVPLDARSVSAKLESGEADVAIGTYPREISNVRRVKLYADPYVSVVRQSHPRLATLKRLDAWLAERHILVTASSIGHVAHEQLERVLITRLDPSKVLVRMPSFVAAAFVASRTDAICTIPAKLGASLQEDLRLVQINPPLDLPSIEISQIWHERVDRDAGHRWLRSLVSGMAKGRWTAAIE